MDAREVLAFDLLWRGKQLEYSFRLTAMGRYEDFRWVTARALGFALAAVGARLPEGEAERLVELYHHLRPFPDAIPALRALSGLGEFFSQRISVDEVRVFKPSPLVYRHAAGRLSHPVGEVRLVTSNAFDCVGASAAGMRTAWVNRSATPFDTIGQPPDLTVPALDRLPAALAG